LGLTDQSFVLEVPRLVCELGLSFALCLCPVTLPLQGVGLNDVCRLGFNFVPNSNVYLGYHNGSRRMTILQWSGGKCCDQYLGFLRLNASHFLVAY